jgi:hypothetical protein
MELDPKAGLIPLPRFLGNSDEIKFYAAGPMRGGYKQLQNLDFEPMRDDNSK